MSKVLIAVMSANNSIAARNLKGIQDSYVRWINEYDTQHQYTVVAYDGAPNMDSPSKLEKICDNMYHLTVRSEDDVYHTFEKTLEAMSEILCNSELGEFDYIIRTNYSTYISIRALDAIVDQIGDDIYCNAVNAILTDQTYLNDIYPRGDFYMMSTDTYKQIMNNFDEPLKMSYTLDHVDDVLVGVAIIKTFGRDYVDKLKPIVYSFIPGATNTCDTNYINGCISARVKGVEPGRHSGATWGDNQYRKLDSFKMKRLYEIDEEIDSEPFSKLSDHLQDETSGRKIMVVQYAQCELSDLKSYIKTKK